MTCLLLQDLEERARFDGVVRQDAASDAGPGAPAEVRVYRSNLAVLPARGEPLQWRLADIEDVRFDQESWSVTLVSSSGRVVISKLARRTEEFIDCLGQARGQVARAGSMALAACLSPLEPEALRCVASMWRDGQAVRVNRLAAIDPGLESALMHNAVDADLRPYVDALRTRSIGIPFAGFTVAREMEDGDGESSDGPPAADAGGEAAAADSVIFWFMYPLASGMVAWETASRSGRATYVFRQPAPSGQGPGSSDASAPADERLVSSLARALSTIGFRRTPIYLSDDALQAPRFRRYLVATRRVPAVALLRRAYAGRVLHGDIDAWAAQLDALVSKPCG